MSYEEARQDRARSRKAQSLQMILAALQGLGQVVQAHQKEKRDDQRMRDMMALKADYDAKAEERQFGRQKELWAQRDAAEASRWAQRDAAEGNRWRERDEAAARRDDVRDRRNNAAALQREVLQGEYANQRAAISARGQRVSQGSDKKRTAMGWASANGLKSQADLMKRRGEIEKSLKANGSDWRKFRENESLVHDRDNIDLLLGSGLGDEQQTGDQDESRSMPGQSPMAAMSKAKIAGAATAMGPNQPAAGASAIGLRNYDTLSNAFRTFMVSPAGTPEQMSSYDMLQQFYGGVLPPLLTSQGMRATPSAAMMMGGMGTTRGTPPPGSR